MSTELVIAVSSAIGGISAALSVLYAVWSFNRGEQEKLLDEIKVDTIDLKNSFRELDLSISHPYFMEIGENFKEKVDSVVGAPKTLESLASMITSPTGAVTLRRFVMLAVEESRAASSSRDHVNRMKRIVVKNGQLFPASASVLDLCIDLVWSNVQRLTSAEFYKDIFNEENTQYMIKEVEGSSHYEMALDDIASVVSDAPMKALNEGGMQELITDTRTILEAVSDMLGTKSYRELRQMSKSERGLPRASLQRSGKFTESLDKLLLAVQSHFPVQEWNQIWAAKARITKLLER